MATIHQKPQQIELWPSLPYAEWKDTLDTLHMWTQIVGKIKLALCPFINQLWQVAFYLTPTGLTTGRIPYANGTFAVDFNFTTHTLFINTSDDQVKTIVLKPRSVAEFYKKFMDALRELDIDVSINPTPVEFADPIPFRDDTEHASYDNGYVERWWRILLQTSVIFDHFRTPFRGKSSPVHFFWGSFDLSGSFFSGKRLPDKTDWPKGYSFMRYAENEENFAFGFWPGDKRFPHPAFYSYMHPAPKSFDTINTGPSVAYFNKDLAECILPYEDVRKTAHPEQQILHFLETTYKESVQIAGWDYKSLEGKIPA